jgi:hypothetical protein
MSAVRQPGCYRVAPHRSALGGLREAPLNEHGALRVRDGTRLDLEHAVGEVQPREHRVGRDDVVVRASAGELG